jgi:hypothetical protein
VVTFILWRLAVLWWNTHRVNSVSNLIVAYMPGLNPVAIGQVVYPSVEILFENQTSSIVYITSPRMRNCSARFPVPITTVKDTGENAYPLSFLNPASGMYQLHQITLQTNDKAKT